MRRSPLNWAELRCAYGSAERHQGVERPRTPYLIGSLVDCPGDLAAEVGKVMRCTLTAGPDELGVTVTVTEVEGSQIAYDIEVDEM